MANRFLIAFIALTVVFLLQQYRFLSLGGTNPNLLLLGFLFFVFKQENLWFLGSLFLGVAAVSFLFTWLWFLQTLVIFLVTLVFYFVKKIMTGNRLFDFLIALFLGTVLFYIVIGFGSANLPYLLILGEILYNLTLGALFWSIISLRSLRTVR